MVSLCKRTEWYRWKPWWLEFQEMFTESVGRGNDRGLYVHGCLLSPQHEAWTVVLFNACVWNVLQLNHKSGIKHRPRSKFTHDFEVFKLNKYAQEILNLKDKCGQMINDPDQETKYVIWGQIWSGGQFTCMYHWWGHHKSYQWFCCITLGSSLYYPGIILGSLRVNSYHLMITLATDTIKPSYLCFLSLLLLQHNSWSYVLLYVFPDQTWYFRHQKFVTWMLHFTNRFVSMHW